ncbi:MAG: hypothetical protein ACOC8F_07695 [Planctomycetota bacterium]
MTTDAHRILLVVVGVLVAVVMLWVVLRYFRLFYRSARAGWPKTEYIPVEDPNPPEPVVASSGVTILGMLGLAWAAAHVAGVFAWAWGDLLPRNVHYVLMAIYLICAAVTTSIGVIMLLRGQRYGRRAVAMGQFLFAMVAYMGLAVTVLLLLSPTTPPEQADAAWAMAVVVSVHLAVDTALGWGAHRVGLPAEATT